MLANIALDYIKNEFAKEPLKWKILSLCPEDDMLFLKNECNAASEFDPLQMRKAMLDGLYNGQSHMTVATCPYGTIHAIYQTPEQYHHIPWELWGRILRMYTEDLKSSKQLKQSKEGLKKGIKPFKIFFLANDAIRQFPKGNTPITAININGGYTYHCNRETIIIYRAEDATRVLLHELMHACCLDRMELGVDHIEAETEAWAELLYVGFLSRGNSRQFYKLLQQQSSWIIQQNKQVRLHMRTPMAFPWRYTIGKEDVWRRWDILHPGNKVRIGNSLRLTCAPDDMMKKLHGVSKNSIIL